ncbi:hypothetical protein DP939_10120 [Spongiactinospora rosea]|uniref:PucR C-terminal helix-turn-helix domain-containing protein n=1 Tax=Spongiactinospora rosea TaxID=2248750 RepID=A0A366M1V1_9ACTN|nr:helix-turn-helix domain-containing protein [Spongiactinospora rosea]RBQ20165.1 hypothetical protein DP939_10120 [Spongiactinospora rosea]
MSFTHTASNRSRFPARRGGRSPRGCRTRFSTTPKKRQSEPVRTLGVFLEYSGSWNTRAERPHAHVNTVRYRMRRVEEPTGGRARPAGPISSLLYQ